MERTLKKLEHCQTEVTVEFSQEEWKAAQDKAFKKLAKDVTVAGFRKGKAPEKLVKEKINQVSLMDEAINALLPGAYELIITEDKVEPFARPEVNIKSVGEDKLVVVFTITTKPECTLGAYTGLKLGKESIEVTDDDLKASLDAVLNENAMLTTKEDVAAEGDTAVIDFVGKVDGEAFEGGSAENYELVLGSHSFIPGFEEQVVGHKAGEKFDVNVTFPENYVPELKGKAAVFEITLHEVKAKVLPELDDEFVKGLGLDGIETVEALKESKKADLAKEKESRVKNEYLDKLFLKIAEASTFDIPEVVIKEEIDARKKRIVDQMQNQYKITLEQYLEIIGQKLEDFDATLREQSIRGIKDQIIIDAIATKENITVSDEDCEFEYAKLAEQYSMKVEDVKKALSMNVENFKVNIRFRRAEEFLLANND